MKACENKGMVLSRRSSYIFILKFYNNKVNIDLALRMNHYTSCVHSIYFLFSMSNHLGAYLIHVYCWIVKPELILLHFVQNVKGRATRSVCMG